MDSKIISEIRSFNRFYTDLLGLLNRHILDSDYSLSEVRVLFEVGNSTDCTANSLMDRLNMDRGYMSRLIKNLEDKGLLCRRKSNSDRRSLFLCLSEQGKAELAKLEDKSSCQIHSLIAHLSQKEQVALVKAMKHIRNGLLDGLSPIKIRPYRPDDISGIVRMHRELYESEYGFSASFGDYVEEYITKFDKSHEAGKENIWVAEAGDRLAGVIAIVCVNEATAQLRWFLIAPPMRGRRLGHKLIKTAIDFCGDKGYRHITLWTVSLLEAARHLYASYGFKLSETRANEAWGSNITEERWDLYLDAPKE